MEKAVSPLQELFLGKEVEVVLEDYSATNPPPGVTFPNDGILVGFDLSGVVLQRKKADQYVFFPYSTIRCIRMKVSPASRAEEILAPQMPAAGGVRRKA